MASSKPIHLLLIDDDEDDYFLTKDLLNEFGRERYVLHWTSKYEEGIASLEGNKYEVYLVDYRLGEKTGIDFLQQAKLLNPGACVIMLTGQGSELIDKDAMRYGASDYLIKSGLSASELDRTIRYSLEIKRNSDALRESEIKYRSIFEKTKDVIYISTPDGRFVDFNESTVNLFRYSREELFKNNIAKLYYDPRDKLRFEQIIKTNGEIDDFEVTMLTKDGRKRYCLLSAIVQHNAYGEETVYLGIIYDLTRKKKAEEELRKAERLASTARFIQTIAHEVRNPLTNIHLAIEQIRQEMNPTEESELKIYLDIIVRNSDRIEDLVNELRESSQPTEVRLVKYSINKLLDEALTMAMDRIKLNAIKVEKEFDADICDLSLDAGKVKIALLNLIINATEAMEPHKGILKIKTEARDNLCIVTIEDNGNGIEENDLKKLFDPFFTRKTKGIGIGLTMTQNIVLSHGGTIEVESKVAMGTKFIVTFQL
jgi:PAS domain S-box-containing protein